MNITYYTNNNYINTIYCLPILPTLPHNPKTTKNMNEEDLKKFTTWFCSRFDTMQTDMAQRQSPDPDRREGRVINY